MVRVFSASLRWAIEERRRPAFTPNRAVGRVESDLLHPGLFDTVALADHDSPSDGNSLAAVAIGIPLASPKTADLARLNRLPGKWPLCRRFAYVEHQPTLDRLIL